MLTRALSEIHEVILTSSNVDSKLVAAIQLVQLILQGKLNWNTSSV